MLSKHNQDIQNRLDFVRAEQAACIPDTPQYNELQEIINMILMEYQRPDHRGKAPRHSARMYSGHYHLIILNDEEV